MRLSAKQKKTVVAASRRSRRAPTSKQMAMFVAAMEGPVIFTTKDGRKARLLYVGAGEYSLQVGANIGHPVNAEAKGTVGDVFRVLLALAETEE